MYLIVGGGGGGGGGGGYLPTGDVCSLIYWLIMTDSCGATTCLKPVPGLIKKKKKKKKLHRLHVKYIDMHIYKKSFWKIPNISIYIHAMLLFSCSCYPSLCLTHLWQHAHKPAYTTSLNTSTPPPPTATPTFSSQSNFVRSWQCLDLVVWLFRPVFPAALMWTGHPAGHQRIPLHGSRIAGSFYL